MFDGDRLGADHAGDDNPFVRGDETDRGGRDPGHLHFVIAGPLRGVSRGEQGRRQRRRVLGVHDRCGHDRMVERTTLDMLGVGLGPLGEHDRGVEAWCYWVRTAVIELSARRAKACASCWSATDSAVS